MLHIPCHPQSSGSVERTNRTLKDWLAKVSVETEKSCMDLLPAVLCELRMYPNKTTVLSRFEIVTGRLFPTPWVKGNPGVCFTGDLSTVINVYTKALIQNCNVHGNVSCSRSLLAEKADSPFCSR